LKVKVTEDFLLLVKLRIIKDLYLVFQWFFLFFDWNY